MNPARIETLADGVFAIAMTRLAFDVVVTDVALGRIDRHEFRREPDL
jgi:uncharacterized membrane protein